MLRCRRHARLTASAADPGLGSAERARVPGLPTTALLRPGPDRANASDLRRQRNRDAAASCSRHGPCDCIRPPERSRQAVAPGLARRQEAFVGRDQASVPFGVDQGGFDVERPQRFALTDSGTITMLERARDAERAPEAEHVALRGFEELRGDLQHAAVSVDAHNAAP
jgi:hypothetical protein